jgi:hypothetical protein
MENRIKQALSTTLLSALLAISAHAAGPFDGKWVGTAPDAGDCGVLTVTLTVADNMLAGTVVGKHGTGTISPTRIATDGTVQVKYGDSRNFQAGIRFAGDQLAGRFDSFCGVRDTAGKRAQ